MRPGARSPRVSEQERKQGLGTLRTEGVNREAFCSKLSGVCRHPRSLRPGDNVLANARMPDSSLDRREGFGHFVENMKKYLTYTLNLGHNDYNLMSNFSRGWDTQRHISPLG